MPMQEDIEAMAAKKPVRNVGKLPGLVAAACVALTGALFLCAGAEGLAQESSTEKESGAPQVTGFRSARFGMSKSETLKAMQRDFRLRRSDIEEQANDEDRTSSLTATVTDIFPGSGPARVAYVHGYRHKKLIQVNVLWGLPVTEEPDPRALVTTANILRKYFSQLGFDPEDTVMNTRVDDSILIVFRATDEQERMVLLQLISGKVRVAKGEGGDEADLQDRVVSLWLSYVEDIKEPDVFRIEEGMF